MIQRNEREMVGLLGKIDEQLGFLNKWSDAALIKLEAWVKDVDCRLMILEPDLRSNSDD